MSNIIHRVYGSRLIRSQRKQRKSLSDEAFWEKMFKNIQLDQTKPTIRRNLQRRSFYSIVCRCLHCTIDRIIDYKSYSSEDS